MNRILASIHEKTMSKRPKQTYCSDRQMCLPSRCKHSNYSDMYSSEDFERLFIRYKSESYPKGESIQTFCHRNNVPYNLFEKWYKDTRHKVVEVKVSGRPSQPETDKPEEEGRQQNEEKVTEVRILLDLRVSNGLHLRQRNLSYGQLKRLVEKLEGLC